MTTHTHTNPITPALDALQVILANVKKEKDALRKQAEALDGTEKEIQNAIDGLKPMVARLNLVGQKPARVPIKWKAEALQFLNERPGEKFQSGTILEHIHPAADSLNKADRKRAIIGLSSSLKELVDGKHIKSEKAVGRGKSYYVAK